MSTRIPNRGVECPQPEVTMIAADRIDPGPNDRHTFDPERLAELADSIRTNGLAQPPTVRPVGKRWEIVCGERRIRAITEHLGWDEIPCIVRELTDDQAAAVMLAENVSRADLDPIEEAQAYRRRIDTFGWTTEGIAEEVGVPRDRVLDRLALLQLTPSLQELVRHGQLPIKYGVRMYQLDHDRQVTAARLLSSRNLIWSEFVRLVDRLLMTQQQDLLFDASAWVAEELEADEPPSRSRRRCRWCGGDAVIGSTCPLSIKCPSCRAKPGSWCRLPYGHVGGLHPRRRQTAERRGTQKG